jgi:hypothetical protein
VARGEIKPLTQGFSGFYVTLDNFNFSTTFQLEASGKKNVNQGPINLLKYQKRRVLINTSYPELILLQTVQYYSLISQ